jgi:hypothetical protein
VPISGEQLDLEPHPLDYALRLPPPLLDRFRELIRAVRRRGGRVIALAGT